MKRERKGKKEFGRWLRREKIRVLEGVMGDSLPGN